MVLIRTLLSSTRRESTHLPWKFWQETTLLESEELNAEMEKEFLLPAVANN